MQCLIGCMETQFDECPIDRPLILHRLYTLACLMPGWQVARVLYAATQI